MSQRKVCVVVNSRANYGRIKSFLRAASDHPGLELQLVVGASALLYRFGKAIDVIREDGFEPQAIVYSIVDGETPVGRHQSNTRRFRRTHGVGNGQGAPASKVTG